MLPAMPMMGMTMLAAAIYAFPRGSDAEDSGSREDVEAPADNVERWVERAQSGDMQAFRRLYDRFLPYVRKQVGRLVGPQESEVDEVTQEVFVDVYEGLEEFEGRSKFKTWLYRVARNKAISHLRGQKTTVDLEDVRPLKSDARTFSKIEARDQVEALYTVLDQCKPESREAFVLYEVEEMKLKEIAELTDASINTVGSRVRRTREKLRTFLESKIQKETS
jgi:RNA polymerase sigma-70 factor (ECF subfamily)